MHSLYVSNDSLRRQDDIRDENGKGKLCGKTVSNVVFKYKFPLKALLLS